MDAETFFIEHLAEIQRAIRFAWKRRQPCPIEVEDLMSQVILKLIEKDYEAIRRFEGRCTFEAYVMVIAERLLLDERNRELGKWRPSAEARRMGETAILLETLLVRDQQSLSAALKAVLDSGVAISERELEELASRLPRRIARPRRVSLESASIAAEATRDHTPGSQEEQAALASKLSALLRNAVATLPAMDRAILRMRFVGGMTVAEIARVLRIPQKPMYRLLTGHLGRFRAQLEDAGITLSDVRDLFEATSAILDLGLATSADPEASASSPGED